MFYQECRALLFFVVLDFWNFRHFSMLNPNFVVELHSNQSYCICVDSLSLFILLLSCSFVIGAQSFTLNHRFEKC